MKTGGALLLITVAVLATVGMMLALACANGAPEHRELNQCLDTARGFSRLDACYRVHTWDKVTRLTVD